MPTENSTGTGDGDGNGAAPTPVATRGADAGTAAAAQGFWRRIKEHKVVQWTLVYAAAAYTLLHIVEMVGEAFDWPHAVARVVTLGLFVGVPMTATLAWYHGHRAQHRVSGAELSILSALLIIAGSALWWVARSSHQGLPRPSAAAAPVAAASTSMAPAPPEKSIAVLPFLDMSEKKDQEYFSDGLSEELIDALTRVPDLRVPARTSSFYFKGKSEKISTIAHELGVAHVLEGSVRKSGQTVRVTAQLIRADTGYNLWSATYNPDVKDIFKAEDDISAAVVEVLKAKLVPTPQAASHRTSNAEAYTEYLLGRQFWNRRNVEGFRRAVEAYRKATALDPNYAAAYAGLSYAETYFADSTGNAAGYARAAAAADKAVSLAPDLGAAYAARGYERFIHDWDWAGAQADFAKALALDPADSDVHRFYGNVLACLGRLSDADAAYKRSIALDPLATAAWENMGRYLIFSRNFAAASEALRRALEIEPDSAFGLNDLGTLQLLEGNAAAALATFRKIDAPEFRLSGIAMAEHTLGQEAESHRGLDELTAHYSLQAAAQIAQAYAWRGERDSAFEWLEHAYQQRDGGMTEIKIDPLLHSLRGDPRYQALLRRMKLPE